MTRLILTTDSAAAGGLKAARRAEIALSLEPRLVWGPPRPEAELAMLLARPEAADDRLWSIYRKYFGTIDRNEIGLIDFCERSETIELWIDPEPNAQLTLIWLLGYLRPHEKIASRLTLVQAETVIGNNTPRQLAIRRPNVIDVTNDHFEIADRAWRVYGAPTPALVHSVGRAPSSFRDGPKDQTSDAQLRIGESLDSGFALLRAAK